MLFVPQLDERYRPPIRDRGWRERENIVIEWRYALSRNELLMVRRRSLLASTAACALGIPARGQTPGRTYRVAYFGFTATNSADDDLRIAAFVNRLAELSFVQGRNLIIEWRYAEGKNERYGEFAREMVKTRADLVITGTSTAAHAVVEASRTMPVVTYGINDPLHTGLVASLAHPGGQVTGMSNFNADLVPKRIELFKAAVPSMTKLALARCPQCGILSGLSAASISTAFEGYRQNAQSLGVSLISLDIDADTEFAAAVALLKRETPVECSCHAHPDQRQVARRMGRGAGEPADSAHD